MPHIIIEHSKEIKQEVELAQLAMDLHQGLAEQDTVKLGSLKTRTQEVRNLIIGDNETERFLHVQVFLLKGRSEELKQTMADNLFKIAQGHLKESPSSLSVNVSELGAYSK